jgi:hypothetical protein
MRSETCPWHPLQTTANRIRNPKRIDNWHVRKPRKNLMRVWNKKEEAEILEVTAAIRSGLGSGNIAMSAMAP